MNAHVCQMALYLETNGSTVVQAKERFLLVVWHALKSTITFDWIQTFVQSLVFDHRLSALPALLNGWAWQGAERMAVLKD